MRSGGGACDETRGGEEGAFPDLGSSRQCEGSRQDTTGTAAMQSSQVRRISRTPAGVLTEGRDRDLVL